MTSQLPPIKVKDKQIPEASKDKQIPETSKDKQIPEASKRPAEAVETSSDLASPTEGDHMGYGRHSSEDSDVIVAGIVTSL